MLRRAPFIVLLFIALFTVVVRIVAPSTANGGAAVSTPTPTPSPTPTPTPTGTALAITRSLDAVQRAFNAGDVRVLCRSGALVDPAVIRQQRAGSGGCESELETLIANEPPLKLTVRSVTPRPDLATANVATASGAAVAVDFVRRGKRWLLSFSDGADPMPALAAGS